MSSALLVGQPNVGKTCFLINFARYLGISQLNLLVRQPAGFMVNKSYQLETAEQELTSLKPHRTKQLQHIKLKLPAGKQDKQVKLFDSCGLVKGIHSQARVRKGMAQTLNQLFNSEIVLHMIDISKFNRQQGLERVDREIYEFLQNQTSYKIIANKIDLDYQQQRLRGLQELVGERMILPISALYQQGFKQVKAFLLHNL